MVKPIYCKLNPIILGPKNLKANLTKTNTGKGRPKRISLGPKKEFLGGILPNFPLNKAVPLGGNLARPLHVGRP